MKHFSETVYALFSSRGVKALGSRFLVYSSTSRSRQLTTHFSSFTFDFLLSPRYFLHETRHRRGGQNGRGGVDGALRAGVLQADDVGIYHPDAQRLRS